MSCARPAAVVGSIWLNAFPASSVREGFAGQFPQRLTVSTRTSRSETGIQVVVRHVELTRPTPTQDVQTDLWDAFMAVARERRRHPSFDSGAVRVRVPRSPTQATTLPVSRHRRPMQRSSTVRHLGLSVYRRRPRPGLDAPAASSGRGHSRETLSRSTFSQPGHVCRCRKSYPWCLSVRRSAICAERCCDLLLR